MVEDPFFLTNSNANCKINIEKWVTSWGEDSSSRAVSNQLVVNLHVLSITPVVDRKKRKLYLPVGISHYLKSFIIIDRHIKWLKNSGEQDYQQGQNNKIYFQIT